MSNDIAFYSYVGQNLGSLLPYRKRGLVFRQKVCEWAAVAPMAKAAFFIGCALAYTNKSAAEGILTETAASQTVQNNNQDWRDTFSEVVLYLERGRKLNESTGMMTFEDFYPEVTSGEFNQVLLSPEECAHRVGQWVIPGLICGSLFPEVVSSMLEKWLTQDQKWKNLGVGGLQVNDTPLLTNVEDTCKYAQSIYKSWQRK